MSKDLEYQGQTFDRIVIKQNCYLTYSHNTSTPYHVQMPLVSMALGGRKEKCSDEILENRKYLIFLGKNHFHNL